MAAGHVAGDRMGACETSPQVPRRPLNSTRGNSKPTKHLSARLPRARIIRRRSSESSSFVLGCAANGSASGRSSLTPPTTTTTAPLRGVAGNRETTWSPGTRSASMPEGQVTHALDTPGPHGCGFVVPGLARPGGAGLSRVTVIDRDTPRIAGSYRTSYRTTSWCRGTFTPSTRHPFGSCHLVRGRPREDAYETRTEKTDTKGRQPRALVANLRRSHFGLWSLDRAGHVIA